MISCYKFYCSYEKIKLINRNIMLERIDHRDIAAKKGGKIIIELII